MNYCDGVKEILNNLIKQPIFYIESIEHDVIKSIECKSVLIYRFVLLSYFVDTTSQAELNRHF